VSGGPQQRAEAGDHQPDILLAEQGQAQPDGHRSPALPIRRQRGQAKECSRQGFWVEVPDRCPLQGREG
jgi:hypothetical protein